MTASTALKSEAASSKSSSQTGKQSMFIIRHGDRWDYSHPEWKKSNPTRPGDPSLSDLGFAQARDTGRYLGQLLKREKFDLSQLIVLASPFLRTIQTANEIVAQIEQSDPASTNSPSIKLECSVWEIDGDDGINHRSLPSPNGLDMGKIIYERQQYFPRIDTTYNSLFVPEIPETKMDSLKRLEKAVQGIEKRYPIPSESRQPIIVVTHAAACIGLAKAAAKSTLQEINPAGPCSIFRLDRGQSPHWSLDHYSISNGMNGYLGHLREWGTATIPWNNFGPKDPKTGHSMYSGPPRSEVEHLFKTTPPNW